MQREPGDFHLITSLMLRLLKELLDDIGSHDSRSGAPGVPSLRLAAAVLLMEVMRASDGISAEERATATKALGEQFGMSQDELASLLLDAEQESIAAYDYFRFTNPLDERLSQPGKIALIEAMWRVAYADRQLDVRENAVISKVADLLHVSHGDYIAAKMRAKAGARMT